jgi:hypothetical protein
VTFPDVETTTQPPVNLTRQKRQLAEQAIAQAADAQWADAAETNRKLLELGQDAEAENRLAKALWRAARPRSRSSWRRPARPASHS